MLTSGQVPCILDLHNLAAAGLVLDRCWYWWLLSHRPLKKEEGFACLSETEGMLTTYAICSTHTQYVDSVVCNTLRRLTTKANYQLFVAATTTQCVPNYK